MLLILLQIQIVCLLVVIAKCNSLTAPPIRCPPDQASALLELKNSFNTTGDNYTTFRSWVAGTDCCSWAGVRCSRTRRPCNLLNLGDHQLQANVLEPALFRLTSLKHLDLSGNDFNMSQLPATGFEQLKFLADLSNMTVLKLSKNKFEGPFPSIIFQHKNLQTVDLSENPGIFGILPNFSRDSKLENIYVSTTNFSGTIPSSIGNLKYLKMLDLGVSGFAGILPSSMEYFDLSFNNFGGPIPVPRDGSVTLDYSSNQFSSMPLDYSTYLGDTLYFKASRNNLSGNLTPSICVIARSTQLIDISYNNLSGSIPSCLLEDASALQVLSLKENNLSGEIPDNIKKGCALEAIDFSGNLIEGKIPRSLLACKNMEILDIGSNQISDTFPCWMSTLPKLQVLVLKSNKFTGQLLDPLYNEEDRNKCEFSALRIADMASNNFSGTLPEGWFKILKSMKAKSDNGTLVMENQYYHGQTYQFTAALTYKGYDITISKILRSLVLIDVSNNIFQGNIPKAIGELELLRGLNMSHNALEGPIPPQFGNLKQLESLDLSSNEVSGEIPPNLASLNFLSTLNLSYNMLTGPIPNSPQFFTFSYSSFLGNIGLCGPPVSKQCSNQTEKRLIPNALEQYSLDPLLLVFTALGFGVCFSITTIVIWESHNWKQC
ncbi:hypothetical protein PR202_gb00234 [Eleusine coracana subsp. coracana]|uniref:Leucine-rich repeat-containing N-terminal plant-type domain-containing protein n=1 Tax=Eleusine coracana subsp. coracana TaxID=191504 RepID=A0AAV5DTN3_ELECO|nr:hypothetical protein PR202_gb00234 [Eleusine coracana subsp. coracana]